jgi:hypothetical protein
MDIGQIYNTHYSHLFGVAASMLSVQRSVVRMLLAVKLFAAKAAPTHATAQ